MKQVWQILNILSVIFAIAMNYLVSTQVFHVASIKDVSDKYATLLTPATYAFSIWGLIYFLLIIFATYQARDLSKPSVGNKLPNRAGPYFTLANIGNALWTYVFVKDFIGLSVIILLGMVVSLFILLYRLNIAMYNAQARTIVFVWWPLMLYAGWVIVASIVNIASWLASLGITLSPFAVLAVLILFCGALLTLLFTRNVRELVLASSWGIVAIGVQQAQPDGNLVVSTAAFTVGALLLFASAVHAYVNRRHNILTRMLG
jgi:hypothetical protein